METINKFESKEIFSILMPTVKAFAPLLAANSEAIKSVSSTTHQYGPTPRQKLDIYPASSASSPILVFLYGGGLTRGDKILQVIPGGVVYHNLGTFFAKQGYTTVIPDYRRVNDAQAKTGEDAVFPSGGEDLSLVLDFLEKQENGSKRDVYVMGNSAGGLHTSTFMLYSKFKEQRRKLMSGSGSLHLKGAIMMSVPCDFDTAAEGRMAMLSTYYPPKDSSEKSACKEYEPCGLLRGLDKDQSRSELGVPPFLQLEGELDPEDEILGSMTRFRQTWGQAFGDEGIEVKLMEGHNHISPPMGLMSGEDKAEKWGHDVVAWMKKVA